MKNLYQRLSQSIRARWSFTTIVTGMVMFLLALGAISLPAVYVLVHIQYQHGQMDSESDINASYIASELNRDRGLRISDPSLQKFVNEDVVYRDADERETRAVLTTDGKILFANDEDKALAWPVISKQAPIIVSGEIKGYYLISRSLAYLLYETAGIFLSSLSGSALIAFLLHRFVLRRLRLAEDDLSRNAKIDFLTGLPNRREALIELRRRLALDEHDATAIFFIDLDKFKMVNDSYGHAVGDAVLKTSADRLRNCLRPEDFLGRLSGDEFVMLLNLDDGEEVVKRVSGAINEAFSVAQICLGYEVAITATVGIALAPEHGNHPEQLMQRADTAMYSLKGSRRGGWTIYDPTMTERIDREVHLRAKLKQALQRKEFEMHYQPLLRLSDNKTVGAEALIRWRDPETGLLVLPANFIPELELSGLIVPVGEWALRTACKQVVKWRETIPDFFIAINVSARQFSEAGFVDSVVRILCEEKVAPDAIEIELTESMLLEDAQAIKMLGELKDLGVGLALDDFGTGFSSLGRLASMPFDVIKIDRQFIDKMEVGEREHSVVVSIVALSHGLGMTVLAEGIETAQQRQALVELGCERGQGFLFAVPIPAAAFDATYIDDKPAMNRAAATCLPPVSASKAVIPAFAAEMLIPPF